MNQEQPAITYDRFFLKPVKERRKIFNEISAENRAFLVKTQAERWLATNRSRLTPEQISLVGEMIQSISPEFYKTGLDFEKIDRKNEALFKKKESIMILLKKAEAILSREDLSQMATIRAEYIPVVEDEND